MGRDRQAVLSPAQVRTLRRLINSRDTPAYLARRAEIVLDEDRARATGAERVAGVTRQTASKWLRRFLSAGTAGLQDAPRHGRPPLKHSDAEQAVLLAPLFADSPAWTSRSLAVATGQTQSAVARVWKRTFQEARTPLGDALPMSGLTLGALFASADCSVLILRSVHPGPSGAKSTVPFTRSPLRPSLQTILAADLLCGDVAQTGSPGVQAEAESRRRPTDPTVGFLHEVRRRSRDDISEYAVCTSPSVVTVLRDVHPRLSVVVVDRNRWQGLLQELGPRFAQAAAADLAAAQHRAMEWARVRDGSLSWFRDDTAASRATMERRYVARSQVPQATSEAIVDAVIAVLQQDIVAGRLRGGDRITERYLARSVHASSGHVRDALRVLASRGLVELEPNRGARVPKPEFMDVAETYAARRALGAVIVRRAAESPVPGHLPLLERALHDMLETSKTGDAWATGEADLRFQDVMAAMTGMRRVPAMFSSLTPQLRLFVAVIGLRYAYSIPEMCRDTTALFGHIADRNGPEAMRVWNSKMDDAVTYMIQQLNAPTRRGQGMAQTWNGRVCR